MLLTWIKPNIIMKSNMKQWCLWTTPSRNLECKGSRDGIRRRRSGNQRASCSFAPGSRAAIESQSAAGGRTVPCSGGPCLQLQEFAAGGRPVRVYDRARRMRDVSLAVAGRIACCLQAASRQEQAQVEYLRGKARTGAAQRFR